MEFGSEFFSRCIQQLSEALLLLLCDSVPFPPPPQDNNGVIGLVEPLKTSKVPVKLPMMEQVVKIASGKKTFFQFFDRDLFLVFF